MTPKDYALMHIRASGPVSFASVQYWLESQAPHVDEENSITITANVLLTLAIDGEIEIENNSYRVADRRNVV